MAEEPAEGTEKACFCCGCQLTREDELCLNRAKLGHEGWLWLCKQDVPIYRATGRSCKASLGLAAWKAMHMPEGRGDLQLQLIKIKESDVKEGRIACTTKKRGPMEWAQLRETKKKSKQHLDGKKIEKMLFEDYVHRPASDKPMVQRTERCTLAIRKEANC